MRLRQLLAGAVIANQLLAYRGPILFAETSRRATTSSATRISARRHETFCATARDILRNDNYAASTNELLTPLLNYIGTIRRRFIDYCEPNIAACSEVNNEPYPYPYLGRIENGVSLTSYRVGAPGRSKELPIVSRLLIAEYAIENCRRTYNLSAAYTGPDVDWSLK